MTSNELKISFFRIAYSRAGFVPGVIGTVVACTRFSVRFIHRLWCRNSRENLGNPRTRLKALENMNVQPWVRTTIVVGVTVFAMGRAGAEESSSVIRERLPPDRWLIALGYGGGGLTDKNDRLSQGMATSLHLGYRLSPSLHLVLAADTASFARSADLNFSQQQSSLTLGLRWAPWERPVAGPSIDFTNFYVRGGLGVGHVIESRYDTLSPLAIRQGDWGLAATGALGWAPLRGAGWSLGLEVADSAVAYGANDVRHNFGALMLLTVRL